jgi:acyl-homoserine lactone acylase PvdQ
MFGNLGVLLWVAAAMPVTGHAESIEVLRDEWGIPHVYAETEAGAAYALGYAQAEDRLEQLLRNYRLAVGTMAEAFGEDHVEDDWQQRIAGHEEVSRRRYPELPAEVRAMLEAFQAGVREYMKRHPDEVPEWAPELEPWQILALGRRIIFNWPVGQAMGELERRGEVELPFGSNEWAVRPERTAEGCAILCIDPHIPWDSLFRFYEFRAHGGRYNVSGFGPLGSPLLGLGHNEYLGWACTTGGPDTADVYAEEVNPDNPLQYRYDGKWRDVQVRNVTIKVKGKDPVRRELHSSHHGPIVLREGNRAYAIATPYLGEVDFTTQFHRMCLARNLDEFKAAVGMNQLMEQNVMYADVEGNVFYVRTGRVPIRPEGFDFSKPVPGNTSKSEWLGIHPMDDLVQLLNPSCGYMQNCNIGPDGMLPDSPLQADRYPAYIYGTGPGSQNPRGRRALELLAKAGRMTLEDATRIALDTYAGDSEHWRAALASAAEASAGEAEVKALKEALDLLAKWDGHMRVDSAAATLYWVWRAKLKDGGAQHGESAILREAALPREQQEALLRALAAAKTEIVERHGRLTVPWGEVHRVRRGDRSWPAAGGDYTLRAIGSSEEGGVYYGKSGQSWTQVVLFRKGAVESYSATPYGQSDHADSPHYTDQAEKLFSQCRLKPTWFRREALEGHTKSATKLRWQGDK